MKPIVLTILWLCGVLLAAPALAVDVSVEQSSPTAVPGEQVVLTISIRDAEEVSPPELPQADGMRIELANRTPGRSTGIEIYNGRRRQWTVYTWNVVVVPTKLGRLTIPPIRVMADGRMYETAPRPLLVARSETGEPLIVEVDTSRTEAYVEQPVEATLRVWIAVYRQSGIGNIDSDNMWGLIDKNETQFGSFDEPRFVGSRARDVGGGAAPYYVFESRGTIWPERPGTFSVGDIRVAMDYPVRLSRDFFQYRMARKRRVVATPGPVELLVLPLPDEGRPPDFNGAVGRYSIEASARPTEVHVGDPITLTLTIRGEGRLDHISAPLLAKHEPLTRDFKVPDEPLAGRLESDGKVFSQTIRAAHEGVTAVPSIPFSYFDPDHRKFETALSEPIPLKVAAGASLSLSQVVEADATRRAPSSPLIERTEGLLANYADPALLLANQEFAVSRGWGAAVVGCPLLYAAGWFMQRRRLRRLNDTGLHRRTNAAAQARRRLRQAGADGAAPAVGAALTGYVADRFGLPGSSLTAAEARRELAERRVPSEIMQEVSALLAEIEFASFGGGAARQGAALALRAEQLIRRLEAERL